MEVAELFQIELAFTRSPSTELSQMPFEFWLRLFEHFRRCSGTGWKGYLPEECAAVFSVCKRFR